VQPPFEAFLRALQLAADAGRADKYMTAGQLEIKQLIVPGWDSTTGSFRTYPGHTRVNHTKYIVTDQRVNIGTSKRYREHSVRTAQHPGWRAAVREGTAKLDLARLLAPALDLAGAVGPVAAARCRQGGTRENVPRHTSCALSSSAATRSER
jgi:hypothetical protein